jgi:hypothetical protein
VREVAELVEAVWQDLQGPAPARGVHLEVIPGDEGEATEIAIWEDKRTETRITVPSDMSEADHVIHVAEGLQDALAEMRAAWGQARPPCPFHTHPLRARLIRGVPMWWCPVRREGVLAIGAGARETTLALITAKRSRRSDGRRH